MCVCVYSEEKPLPWVIIFNKALNVLGCGSHKECINHHPWDLSKRLVMTTSEVNQENLPSLHHQKRNPLQGK